MFREGLWSGSGTKNRENKYSPLKSSDTRTVGEKPPPSEKILEEGRTSGENVFI